MTEDELLATKVSLIKKQFVQTADTVSGELVLALSIRAILLKICSKEAHELIKEQIKEQFLIVINDWLSRTGSNFSEFFTDVDLLKEKEVILKEMADACMDKFEKSLAMIFSPPTDIAGIL